MAKNTRRQKRLAATDQPMPSHNIQTQTTDDLGPTMDDNSTAKATEEVDIDSSDTEVDSPRSSKHFSKPKIQTFKGFKDKITIDNWFKRFEMLSKFHKWSQQTQILMLGNYFEDDALNWYIENSSEDSYQGIKSKMIARFGLETVEPIIEFVNLRYDFKTGMKEYFEQKRRLGIAAKLTESQIVSLMIHGLANGKLIESFTAIKPKSFAEFYSIAKSAENNIKRNFNAKPNKFNELSKPKNDQTSFNTKRKPPNACRICENLGFKNRFHWASDCRNKGKSQNIGSNETKRVNVTTNEEPLPENDITRIDLND